MVGLALSTIVGDNTGKIGERRKAMGISGWRGTVGVIKPTSRSTSTQDLIHLLPEGVTIIARHNDVRYGELKEFNSAIPAYEAMVADLAAMGVDLIHPEGTPPFMLLGRDGEQKLIRRWQRKFGVPIFTSATNQVNALRALRVKNILHVRATSWDRNNLTTVGYFTDAGFNVLATERFEVPFAEISRISWHEIYAGTKKAVLKHPRAEAIYFQGSGWGSLKMIEPLERDLGIPVVYPVIARCWEIQKRLRIRQPVQGYGRLLAELP